MKVNSVLVIDDSDFDTYLTQRLIQKHTTIQKVYVCHDGAEALELMKAGNESSVFEGNPPQVIFLDINMPKMNGFEFLRKFSAQKENHKGISVYMLTSSSLDSDREQSLAFDVVKGHLQKPLSKELLEEVLAECNRSTGQGRASSSKS